MRLTPITGLLLSALLAACQSTSKTALLTDGIDQPSNAPTEIAQAEQDIEKPDETIITGSVNAKQVDDDANYTIASYIPPADGTVFTWRNNWASLPPVISYKVAGKLKLGTKEYVKFTSISGLKNTTHAYYDTTNFNLKGYRDAKDAALVTFKPAEQRYRFPMKPGDKWVTSWQSKDHKTDKVTSGGGVVQVMAFETIKLPAGEFKTLKLKMPLQRDAPSAMSHYIWFSPKLGVTVKEQIGSGVMNWTQVLEKVEFPANSKKNS